MTLTHTATHVNNLAEVTDRRPTHLAVGSFDGVHRGHQDLLRAMVAAARQEGARAAVLTFFPHPRKVLQTLPPRFYVCTLDDRVRLLAQHDIDLIITHPFDEDVRHTRAADFVDQLIATLDLRALWGGNFALGYNREGDVPYLRAQGAAKGFSVHVVENMTTLGDELVSSRRVRKALETGDIAEANGCLGRPYSLTGLVIRGDQRGRTIGFPTANLEVWDELLLPANGVYATVAHVGERRFAAATNIGVRPTVDGENLRVEAHLLDFDEDLYGQTMTLDFIGRIRDEMKFSGLDALKAQIAADVAQTRTMLADLLAGPQA